MRLKGKPSRSAIFGRAGLRFGKQHWLRRQPDLRMSVVVKLAIGLQTTPRVLFEEILRECKIDPLGNVKF